MMHDYHDLSVWDVCNNEFVMFTSCSQNEDCIRLISLIGIFLIFHQKCHIHESRFCCCLMLTYFHYLQLNIVQDFDFCLRLLLTLSCNYGFYKRLWKMIQTVSIQSSVGYVCQIFLCNDPKKGSF